MSALGALQLLDVVAVAREAVRELVQNPKPLYDSVLGWAAWPEPEGRRRGQVLVAKVGRQVGGSLLTVLLGVVALAAGNAALPGTAGARAPARPDFGFGDGSASIAGVVTGPGGKPLQNANVTAEQPGRGGAYPRTSTANTASVESPAGNTPSNSRTPNRTSPHSSTMAAPRTNKLTT